MSPESRRLHLLAGEIERECRELQRLVSEAGELLSEVGEDPASRFDTRAGGSILSDFYTGLERILTRVARELDGGLPATPEWHRDLLVQMTLDVERVRPAVLSTQSSERLSEYLRFRHLFRHLYGFHLDWTRIRSLLQAMPEVWREVSEELARFRGFLSSCAQAMEGEG